MDAQLHGRMMQRRHRPAARRGRLPAPGVSVVAVVALAAGCGGSNAGPLAVDEPPAAQAARSGAAGEGEPASSVGEREGLVVVPSEDSVEANVERIRQAVETDGGMVTVIDHAQAARGAGLDLPPTTLLLIGNPAVGTPLMQEARTVGIDLPLKMLVWEEGEGRVQVAYNDPAFLARRHGITGQDERIERIAATLERLASGDDESSSDADDESLPDAR